MLNQFQYPYGQYQQMPYQQPQLQRQEIVRVNGENGARAYQIAPNSSVLLLDEQNPIVWLKTSDGAGYATITPYSITPIQSASSMNDVNLCGYICKKPTHRFTPKGKRISDVIIAINRTNTKSDYIPCILWGSNADYVATLNVGDCISLSGRVQSREYIKGNEKRTAYEVSCDCVDVV